MDELINRQMPHSIEAEQAVIGSMVLDARCVPEVVGILKAADFYSTINRDIYETIFSMFTNSLVIDPVTVLEQMRVAGVWSDNSASYLLELVNITPTSSNVKEYAGIVKDTALLRAIADAGGDIFNMALDGAGGAMKILEVAEQRVYALRQGRNATGLEPIGEILVDVYDQLREAARRGTEIPGLPTGLIDLDYKILGLNKSDLILIASRPGMGKTSIALNIGMHVAKMTGSTVAVFSLEMSREQLALRLLSSTSEIDNKKLQMGRLSTDEWNKLGYALNMISNYKILINDNPTLSVADMNAQCRRIQGLGLVIIDYLQLMTSATGKEKGGGENRTQVVSDISRAMKIMAKELNVPVICLSQLSRANEKREDRRPKLSDLRESGAIEQDADIVLGLYRDDYYDKETESGNIAECIILKNRRGETDTIQLEWRPEFTSYRSLDSRHSER